EVNLKENSSYQGWESWLRESEDSEARNIMRTMSRSLVFLVLIAPIVLSLCSLIIATYQIWKHQRTIAGLFILWDVIVPLLWCYLATKMPSGALLSGKSHKIQITLQ